MQPWMWLSAYVLGFGLLQILLYRHFSARTATPEPADGRRVRTDGGGRRVSTEPSERVVCPHCDAVNESHSMIRYCGSCTESLR